MFTGDRLIINRLPVTFEAFQNNDYLPERGEVVVFRNPNFQYVGSDEYIVKRVIGLPNDRVRVNGGDVTVYNRDNPDGFDPYQEAGLPDNPVTGEVDQTVQLGEIFVIGDNRSGQDSLDSRNGLGTVPLNNIVGPVSFRIYPFDGITSDF